MSTLELSEVSCGYGPVLVVRDVSLMVEPGEIAVLLGSNGAGKSTLLKAIAGLLRPTAGAIRMDGRDITGFPPERVAAAGLALVLEGRRLFGPMTVRENLLLGAHVRRHDKRGRTTALDRVLTLFPILRERAGQRSDSLSGGQQQMVALARALMGDPRLILLDEPSLGLAPTVVDELFATLLELKAEGTTILLVEQHTTMALAVADHAHVLERGRLVLSGSGREVAEDPRLRDSYLGRIASDEELPA